MFSKVKVLYSLIIFIGLAQFSFSQVTDSGSTSQNAGIQDSCPQLLGQTTIELNVENNKRMPIFIIDKYKHYLSSPNTSGMAFSHLCDAPNKIQLNNGTYLLKASDNDIIAGQFMVTAKGGTQKWEISKGNQCLVYLARALFFVGSASEGFGVTCLALSPFLKDRTLFLFGIGFCAIGIPPFLSFKPLVNAGEAKAKLISAH